VTFLFTDVEGSTRMLDEIGPERYGAALLEHRRLLREAFARHGGVEVDTQGDAFFYAFSEAPAALAAAEAAQAALTAGPIQVRMGLHTGTPHLVEDGYVGHDVHRAARIAACGHGGQVLVSAATAGLVDTRLLRELGEHRLKDLSAPERIHQLGHREFPPLKSLYQTNLPVPSTPFLGRERELAEVSELVARKEVRLLTLTGTGGTGKTRLAAQAAGLVSGSYPEGVWWVPLAALRDDELVLETAAQVLGAREGLSAHIGDKRMLVLFDNFEQVAGAAPGLAGLLASCPKLDLLVTSREPLHLTAEHEYPVPPFAHEEGIGFFLARARAVRPDFEGSVAVLEICRRLDELPLALELAAARVKALSPEQMLERLERRLPLLTGGARDLPERQRTLRSTIEWSHDLLVEDEQLLFRRLAVFSGGCTLEAAEEICEADVDAVQSLVDKSLLRHSGERYWFLETIREFASERLEESGEAEALSRRHAEFFRELAESGNLALDAVGKGRPRHELVLPERDNIRVAIEWATEADVELGLRLALALENFWVTHDAHEGVRRFRALLERSQGLDLTLLARAWRDYGGALDSAGLREQARAAYTKSGELFREAGDECGVAEANFRIGVVDVICGDIATARRRFDESLDVFRRLADSVHEMQVLGVLGQGELMHGDPERGHELVEKSLAMAGEAEWLWWQAGLVGSLAMDAVQRTHDAEQAERYGRECVALARKVEHRNRVLLGLAALAWAAGERRDVERATQLWATVEAEERDPNRFGQFDPDVYRPKISGLQLPRPAMTLEEAMEYALDA
jgi:predicted ATPase